MIDNKISGGEFSLLAFVSLLAPLAFVGSGDLGGNIADTVYSALVAGAINLLLSLPLFLLRKVGVNENSGKGEKIIWLIYLFSLAVFMACDVYTLTKMLNNTIIPEGSPAFMAGFTLLIAGYGAFKGIETVGRSAGIVAFSFLVGLIFMLLAALPIMRKEEYVVPFYEGGEGFVNNSLFLVSRTCTVPGLLPLISDIRGKAGVRFAGFNIAAAVISSLMFLEVQYGLGYYALTQKYPLYTLSSVTEAEPLKRLDLIFIIIFVMAAVLRLSLIFLAAFKAMEFIRGKGSTEKWVKLCLFAVLLAIGAFFAAKHRLSEIYFNTFTLLALVILCSVLLPLVLILLRRKKKL